ncbi:MAG: hypothetical protein AB1306_01320 [Nitrospirota bacterium]
MPRKLKLEGLQAELSAVDALLKQAIEVGDPIGEMQLSRRKQKIENEVNQIDQHPVMTASVALFFGGEPVLGSRGISADFAGHTLELFQELVSRTFAKTEVGVLGTRGPIPLKQRTTLMVTEIAKGSFGFILDELSDQTEIVGTELKLMVEEVTRIIERTASPNEIEFEEVAETLDARTLIALRDFFVNLDSSAATLRVVEDVVDIALDSPSIHRARLRTEATSIDEEEEFIEGELFGFLPEHRKFELRLEGGDVVYGSVSKEASEQYKAFINSDKSVVGRKWKLKVRKRVVKPLNRPHREVYWLLEFTE